MADKNQTGDSKSTFDDNESTAILSQQYSTRQLIFSILIVLAVTGTWTGSTQLTKSTLVNPTVFNAPFFLMWFGTVWMVLCFPLYFLTSLLLAKSGLIPERSMQEIWSDASQVLGKEGITMLSYALKCFPFLLFWIGANYSYSRALVYASPAQVTATFSSNLAFVYVLSLLFLRDMVSFIKLLAIGLSIAGIVLMAYSAGFGSAAALGIILVVISFFSAAVYKVAFKRLVGDANLGQVSLFMTLLGLSNCFLVFPVVIGLFVGNAELAVWGQIPWKMICGSAALGVAFNFSINFGIAYTHPLYISAGIFLAYPVNAVVDVIVRNYRMKEMEIVGSLLILFGFLLLLIPDRAERKAWAKCCSQSDPQSRFPCC